MRIPELILMTAFLSSCTNNVIPPVELQEVKVSDIATPPTSFSMEPPAKKKKIPVGATNSQALDVITDNNEEDRRTERKVIILQEKMKQLFSDIYK